MHLAWRTPIFALLFTAALAAPAAAQSPSAEAEAIARLQTQLDYIWVLVAAALVFMMQTGFLLLEAGMVRSKNSINVAQKNFLDFMASGLAFAAVGFMVAFGASAAWGPIGWDGRLFLLREFDPWLLAFFVFQVMFCGTAATIVSGAVAERMKLSAYVICAVALAAFIYPIYAHWAWGAALGPNEGAFLANAGYVDFAGSSVVHATGGWFALAACLVLGPRRGRFGPNGEVRRMSGHNPVLAAAGALILFVGWIGFNGGSTVAANTDTAHIIANTIIAGCAGGVAGYLLGWAQDGVVLPDKAVNGCLAGLVAVTAGCMALQPMGAFVIGALGAVVALYAGALLERMRVDDAVGAIGVHGFAGAFGTLALAFLAPAANLPAGNHWAQFGVQSLGVALNFVLAFGGGYAFFWLLNRFLPIRIGADAEDMGLNEAEHDTKLGIGHVESAFASLVTGQPDLNMRLPVEPGDDAERLTRIFNKLMENLQSEEITREAVKETARTEAEGARLSTLANTTFEALCICAAGEIIDANAAFAGIVGLPIEEVKGRRLDAFIAEQHRHILTDEGLSDGAHHREILVLAETGEQVPVDIRSRELVYAGAPTRVIAMIDLRDRKKAEAQIRYLALHEPLTNLPNRALFNERLAALTERTSNEGLLSAVMLIDLDRFKDINDLYGHQAGDEVIKATAERLRAVIRRGDMAARLGGDEFGVLLVGIDFANQAADLAHRLVQELSKPVALPDGTLLRPGASIGVAICPRDGHEGPKLISRADTALYHAKNCGRNTFAMFEPGMDDEIRRRQILEADLSRALEGDQFELYYQARLDVREIAIPSYEALIRWNHPARGMVNPGEFISVAEQSGRIVKIGEWVLRTACRHAAGDLNGARVSVNVSPLQFREATFVERVADILEETGLEPSRLEIEITESVLIDDDTRAIGVLKELKKLGVEIALDDFGTGYSSLGYLSRFPFDTLKIDRSFVSGMPSDANSRSIVETIVRLGRALNMRIVAEGVERQDELAALAEIGCDEIQGYLIGKPQPLAALLTRVPDEVAVSLGGAVTADDPQRRAVLALQKRVEELLRGMPVDRPLETPSLPARKTG